MVSSEVITIHWFRQDLRLSDNPALLKAIATGKVLPIYILDDESAAAYAAGGASRWWLHQSLAALNQTLAGKLNLYRGAAAHVLEEITKRYSVKAVYWNRCYEPWRMQRDAQIKEMLKTQGIAVESCNGSLLKEPWEVHKEDGSPYRVFTPFFKKAYLQGPAPRPPLPAPSYTDWVCDNMALTLADLSLLPRIRWDKQFEPHWQVGEIAAQNRLRTFLAAGISDYKEGRNFPAKLNVSRLSPHLHFGEISPQQVWYASRAQGDDANIENFCSELGWREFSHHLLYHFPALPRDNLQAKFNQFPWRTDKQMLAAWQQGQTGYPIIDAGMRELWQTGYMHNRVRMIVGSFLVKNLLLDWRLGERWFWDCLVDADLANNSASWQWVAGCGADAAPYFRIFNPITQGQKFDAEGVYTRRFVPELKNLPDKYLFCPWTAPEAVLSKAEIALGKTYPLPIVDIAQSRALALAAFAEL
jgi:deoxyribodipyrimidine photo-lyase